MAQPWLRQDFEHYVFAVTCHGQAKLEPAPAAAEPLRAALSSAGSARLNRLAELSQAAATLLHGVGDAAADGVDVWGMLRHRLQLHASTAPFLRAHSITVSLDDSIPSRCARSHSPALALARGPGPQPQPPPLEHDVRREPVAAVRHAARLRAAAAATAVRRLPNAELKYASIGAGVQLIYRQLLPPPPYAVYPTPSMGLLYAFSYSHLLKTLVGSESHSRIGAGCRAEGV
ncbi:hypothetical protein GGX14DRAFT_400389 [Mycena pura]|uniref:Uncharacterized protein n=1 Tax=Mycena pura TaxID=153505 RepID=A0AAD6V622_9AGAR|nr:hypothetical protein GGX14DRAFT_400389 [Mycena pura]